jgi:hypothetical protein
MPDIIDKISDGFKAAVRAITTPAVPLSDPENIDSQVDRSDLKKPDSQPAAGEARKLVELGEERYEESRLGRWRRNADIFTGIALFQGKAWLDYDDASGSNMPVKGANTNPDFDEKFVRKSENIVRVMVERAVARITAAYPDAWAAPLTDSDKDKAAAQIARSVTAHCTRHTHRQRLLRDAILAMLISTTVFIEVGWDPKAMADTGVPQPDGSIEYHEARIGDVVNNLMLAIDAYPDPNAVLTGNGIHDGAYFIKRCIRSVDFVKQKWGKTVKATTTSGTYGSLEQRLEWLADDHGRANTRNKNCTEVTEVWEKPQDDLYPEGRFWAYSGDKTLLWAGPWPYEKKDRYPFVAMQYQTNQASIWGLNMTRDLRDVQISINKLATYLAGRLEWDRPVLFNPDNSQIAPDDLISPQYAQIIGYKGEQVGGAKPTWVYPPPPGDFYFALRKQLMDTAEFIAGVHDFNSDAATPPSSGFEFELRQEEDKSRLRPVIDHISECVVELYEWDIALYRQYGSSFPRLMGIDDKAVPTKSLAGQGAAASAMVDLQALKDGHCRVVLQPGSGEAKLPAAQQEELNKFVGLMAKGIPSPVLEFYLDGCTWIRSDANVDRLIANYKLYEAAQAQQQMAMQSMKGDQAQQQLQAKNQAAQSQANIQVQAEQAKAAIDVHAQSLEQTWRMQADQATENDRFAHSMALLQAKQNTVVPTVSIAVKADPTATASAEEKAGLESSDPATVKAMLMPPKPTLGASSGASDGGSSGSSKPGLKPAAKRKPDAK